MTGVAAVVARFVLEDGREPAAFELVDGLDGVYFVLADQCEEFRVGLEARFEELLSNLIKTRRL